MCPAAAGRGRPPPIRRLNPTALSFADDENPVHTIIIALIAVGIGLPFKLFLEEAFAKSAEPDFPENQLSWCGRLCLDLSRALALER